MNGSLEQQIIRREVEEKLKDFASQVGLKLAEQQALVGKVIEAFQALDARLSKIEEERMAENIKRDGKEL